MRFILLTATITLTAVLVLSQQKSTGEELRIETQIYTAAQNQPVSTGLTLFQDGAVYDFQTHPPQVSVFQPGAGAKAPKFVLLDSRRKLRTEIACRDIDAFMDGLRKWASENADPLLKFTANPRFKEQFNDNLPGDRGELLLTSDVLRYRITTVAAKSADGSPLYRQFNDWNAKLNTMVNVGSTPPFPRLTVSEAMARRNVLAEKVELTLAAHKPYRPAEITIRAVHDIRWRLTQEDHQRVAQAQSDLEQFQVVGYETYRQAPVVGQR